MDSSYKLECCVDTLESAINAQNGGADRLELASHLLIGGMSPSPWFIEQVLELGIPTNVLLRPRFGDFHYDQAEQAVLIKEIEHCRKLGVHGVVIGALTVDGRLDEEALKPMLEAAGDLEKVLHRAFDVTRVQAEALEQAIKLGFDIVLTSGGNAKALAGADNLAKLNQQAAGRIILQAGSGVTAENMAEIASKTGIRQFHLSGKKTVAGPMQYRNPDVPMGLPIASEYDRMVTDVEAIRRAKQVLLEIAQKGA